MLSPNIYAALVHERHQTFLAQAEAGRRTRQARLGRLRDGAGATSRSARRWRPGLLRPGRSRLPGHRPGPAVTGRPVVLRDGSTVLIRPVHSADAPLVADGFARLSARSRQLRFLTPKKDLSPAELRYFTDVDHHDHEALGALNRADGRGVGIARYVRDSDDPHAAEIAVTIVDDWQGRGLGTELVAQLSERARSEGIRRFTALVAADNPAMAGLLRTVRAVLVGREPGALRYEVTLGPADERDPAGVLRSTRRSADRLWSYDTNSGRAQRRADAAGLALSSGSRMKAVALWARYLIVQRGCAISAAREHRRRRAGGRGGWRMTRIAAYGAGGVGGCFGARPARAGAEVHFIARGAHLHALREHGLRVRSVKGGFQVQVQAQATDDPADIGPCQFVLFYAIPEGAEPCQQEVCGYGGVRGRA
jgi:RimJ/RimL family protein N-acetyltransferase